MVLVVVEDGVAEHRRGRGVANVQADLERAFRIVLRTFTLDPKDRMFPFQIGPQTVGPMAFRRCAPGIMTIMELYPHSAMEKLHSQVIRVSIVEKNSRLCSGLHHHRQIERLCREQRIQLDVWL